MLVLYHVLMMSQLFCQWFGSCPPLFRAKFVASVTVFVDVAVLQRDAPCYEWHRRHLESREPLPSSSPSSCASRAYSGTRGGYRGFCLHRRQVARTRHPLTCEVLPTPRIKSATFAVVGKVCEWVVRWHGGAFRHLEPSVHISSSLPSEWKTG